MYVIIIRRQIVRIINAYEKIIRQKIGSFIQFIQFIPLYTQ